MHLKSIPVLTTDESNGAVIGQFNPLTAFCELAIATEKQTYNQGLGGE